MKVKVSDLVWSSDEVGKSLPSEIDVPKEIAGCEEEVILEYVTNLTGCVPLGYVIREEKKTTQKLPKLPNCPFCNGTAKRVAARFTADGVSPVRVLNGYVYPSSTWYGIKCIDCGIAQPKRTYLSREESDAAWIKRSAK